MGTRIEGAVAHHHRGRVFGRGALHLSDATAIDDVVQRLESVGFEVERASLD